MRGEVLRVIHPPADTVATNFKINPDCVHFSPLPPAPLVQATLKPAWMTVAAPVTGLPASILVLLNPFLHSVARVKFSNIDEIIPPV